MTKIDTTFVAFAAFCLGFVASEYRTYLFDLPLTHTSEYRTAKNEREDQAYSAYRTSNVVVDGSNVESNTYQTNQNVQEEGFSWHDVNSLIQSRAYDRALTLLRNELPVSDDSAAVWLALAHIYQQTNQPKFLVEAWLSYLDEEFDAEKSEQVAEALKSYLSKAFKSPLLIGGDIDWLIGQLDALLDFQANDGEIHWMLASLYLEQEDSYQAQYHALMAANDPVAQKRAEGILAQLNGAQVTGDHLLPLIRYGNQYLVNVEINGHAARLLLDTGASLSGVSQDFIEDYPYIVTSKKTIQLNTASGTETSFLFTVDSLTMGELRFASHILARLPMTNVAEFDGLLGVDVLGRFDFIIDQDNLQLRLTPRS